MVRFSSVPASAWWAIGSILLAVLFSLAAWRSRWRKTAGWFALALAGQVSAQQLLVVGNQVRLQLFYSWSDVLGSRRILFFLVVVLVQALTVAWGARTLWRTAWPMTRRSITWPRAILLFFLLGYSAAAIPPELAQAFVSGSGFTGWLLKHLSRVALSFLIYGTAAVNLILLVGSIPEDVTRRARERWQACNYARLAWVCALCVVVVASLLHWVVLDGMPHVRDEVAYVFQAKYMSTGHLYLSAPPDPEAFPCRLCMIDGGKWYSAMLGGWPFILAVGYWAGVPWLVNPLLGGIGILLAFALVRQLYDERVAAGAAVLMAGSPWLLFMSANLMPHALSLVCMLVGLLGVWHARQTGHIGWALAAGFAFGVLFHVRPLEAVGVAIPAGLWWLSAGWRKIRWPALAGTVVAGLALAGLFLAYNQALTGSPWLAPVNKFFDQTIYPGANRLGFGADVGNFGWTGFDALPGHGPIDVILNTNQNLYITNFELFGWACGSLLFVFLLFVWRGMRRDLLMFALILAIWAAMSLYWFSGGMDFGARYWYLMILPLTVLTVRGAQFVADHLLELSGEHAITTRTWAFVGLATVLGLVTVIPWRSLDKYPNYRGMRGDVRRLARESHFGRSLVLVRGEGGAEYESAFALNPPTISPDAPGPIYALDRGPASREVLFRFFPNRPVWIVAAPSVTGDEFRVVEGPLKPSQLR